MKVKTRVTTSWLRNLCKVILWKNNRASDSEISKQNKIKCWGSCGIEGSVSMCTFYKVGPSHTSEHENFFNCEVRGGTEIKFTYQLWKANAIIASSFMNREVA